MDISLVTIIFQSIFLGFPDEIIEMIFDKLDFIDLCNVRGVNKRFYRIEGKVKKPLLKRKNLMISVGSTLYYICLKNVVGRKPFIAASHCCYWAARREGFARPSCSFNSSSRQYLQFRISRGKSGKILCPSDGLLVLSRPNTIISVRSFSEGTY